MSVGPTQLVLLGHPVAHSLSPAMQRAALAAAGLEASYEAMDVAPDDLADAVEVLRANRTAGNVTVPHKEHFAALCDMLTPLAMTVEAVNTFWFEPDGRLVGDNTDVGGFDFAARFLLHDAVEDIDVLVRSEAPDVHQPSRAIGHAHARRRRTHLVRRFARTELG